ncbi:MAG: hypothetical protein ABIN89_10045 [Chitinophagaceae bacterium]
MSGPEYLQFFGNSPDKKEQEMLFILSTKNQDAGEQVHKVVIRLLKHISVKYLINFKLVDEGNYWETTDEKILEEKFRLYNKLLDAVSTALESFPITNAEPIEDYFERILKKINSK